MAHQAHHDFIAETNGSCFLCSNKIPIGSHTTDLTKSPSPTIYSLDCLSRYLKIDMKTVFTGSVGIPPRLVARVEKSRLKTKLCEKCAVLTKKFSKLYNQLEKIEMEMTSCLNTVQDNLEEAVKPENKYKANDWSDLNGNEKEKWTAKLEIINALRKDALQKCSRKLGAVHPFTKVQRMTSKQITAEKRKIESRKVVKNYLVPTNYEDDNADIGSPQPLFSKDDHDNYLDEQIHYPPHPHLTTAIKTESETVEREVMEGINGPEKMEIEQRNQTSGMDNSQIGLLKQRQTKKTLNREVDQLPGAIPPPIIVGSEAGVVVEKPDISKNPETGKYKCRICSKEYALYTSSYQHFRSVHLKIRHQCSVCRMDFPFKQAYEVHYLNIHMGVKFKCGKCDKTFALKAKLRQHQKCFHAK